MKQIEVNYAIRKALNILDEWIDVTGAITKHSGYHGELESIVEDAVRIGALVALEHNFEINENNEIIDLGLKEESI